MSSIDTPRRDATPVRSALRNLSNSNTRLTKSAALVKHSSPTGKPGQHVARKLTFAVAAQENSSSHSSMAKRGESLSSADCGGLPFAIYEDSNDNEVKCSALEPASLKPNICELASVKTRTTSEMVKIKAEEQQDHRTSVVDSATQTNMTDEEVDGLFVADEPSAEYYKQLAEARRVALADALHENETMFLEIAALRNENARLLELAEQAEYFANMTRALLSEADGDVDATPDDAEQSDDFIRADTQRVVTGNTRPLNSTRNDEESALCDSGVHGGASCSLSSQSSSE